MSCDTQVHDLGTALQVLMDSNQHTIASKIPWQRSVVVTANFSRCAEGQCSGRLRQAEHLAILPDCSIVGISSREAEYLLRAEGYGSKGRQWL